MPNAVDFRLLGATNNERGDLFTRLTSDLFFALGYHNLRFDVHKSGREIDIQGVHRFEPRRLVAECKAHKEKIGGADTNKLLGVLTRERDKAGSTPVTGYFVSLSGFRETGIEQEHETSEQTRVILIDGTRVIDELIGAKIVVSADIATEKAGHCAEQNGLIDAMLDGTELFGHPLGYIWVVYYSLGKLRTHFALIHADGTPLAAAASSHVIQADKDCAGVLHSLTYLAPPIPAADREALAERTMQRYRQWV
ncbi:MAG: restriction endonuclease, partial [Planctomycetaceae bacterium]|nr:restriction endonuclease [Planctomycetaceae bacterium]